MMGRRDVGDDVLALPGLHPPGAERPAVADLVDDVVHGSRRVAGEEEERLHRVHAPVGRHGVAGRDDGLRRDLAAEGALQSASARISPERRLAQPVQAEDLRQRQA